MDLTGQEFLAKVAALPISTWRYDWEPEGIVHVGPMAQDFAAAFHLGSDETVIAHVDATGVLFVAVQALLRRIEDLEAQLDGRTQDVPRSAQSADEPSASDHRGA